MILRSCTFLRSTFFLLKARTCCSSSPRWSGVCFITTGRSCSPLAGRHICDALALPMRYSTLAAPAFSWYGCCIDMTPFDLTPAQKDRPAALAQETGKSIPTLLAEALDGLQDRVRSGPVNGEANGGAARETAMQSPHRCWTSSETPGRTFLKMPGRSYPPTWPRNMTTTSMAHQNVPYETPVCRCLLLDRLVACWGPVAPPGCAVCRDA